jgi:hypothetical protein
MYHGNSIVGGQFDLSFVGVAWMISDIGAAEERICPKSQRKHNNQLFVSEMDCAQKMAFAQNVETTKM